MPFYLSKTHQRIHKIIIKHRIIGDFRPRRKHSKSYRKKLAIKNGGVDPPTASLRFSQRSFVNSRLSKQNCFRRQNTKKKTYVCVEMVGSRCHMAGIPVRTRGVVFVANSTGVGCEERRNANLDHLLSEY